MRESWTDARLDDFAAHVDKRFDTLERRMDDGFARIDARLDAFQRTMILFCGGLLAALIAGFFGLIATQL